MRAVFFESCGKPLVLRSVPDPTPGEGQLVIKVARCGICGSDVHLTQLHGFYAEHSVLGHEFSGEIVAVGKSVTSFRVRERITAMPISGCGTCGPCLRGAFALCENGIRGFGGGFADFVTVDAAAAVRLPSTLSMEDGALVEPLAVGLHGVVLAKMRPGARVLVLGAGAIGLAAVFWARQLGAGSVAAMSRSPDREAMSLHMGADHFVTSGQDEVEAVRLALGGAPDMVLECIGVVGALGQALNHVRPEGTVVSLGFCTKPDPVLPALATYKQATLIFSMAYTLSEFQRCVEVLDRGHVEPRAMITSRIPLEEVPAAVARMQATGGTEVKVMADLTLG